jgi:hypothetical protein
MAIPKTLLTLLVGTTVTVALSADAAPRKTHKTAPAKAVQVPFSFISPSHPSPALLRLQDMLQGRVIEQHLAAPAQASEPPIVPPAPPAADAMVSDSVPAITSQAGQKPALKAKRYRPAAPDYPERSWVSDLNASQAIPLAVNVAEFLARQFPPETTTLLLAIPHKQQLNNPFTPELEAQLRQTGFTLATTRAQAPQAQLVRYQIGILDEGVLVQLETPHHWISRYYPFTPTQALMATHPFSIRTLGDAAP